MGLTDMLPAAWAPRANLSLLKCGVLRQFLLPAVCWFGLCSGANAAAQMKGLPFRLGGLHPARIFCPRVLMSRNGHALAIWSQGGAGSRSVWVNSLDPRTGWRGPQRAGSGMGDELDPKGALNARGAALLLWCRTLYGVTELVAAGDQSTHGWQPPVVLDGTGGAVAPEVVLDDEGNAIAVWSRYDSSWHGYDLIGARCTSRGWQPPKLLAKGQSVPGASLAGNGDGTVVALWSSRQPLAGTSHRHNTWACVFAPDFGWSVPVSLGTDIIEGGMVDNDRSLAGHHSPKLAFCGAGRLLALWQEVPSEGRGSRLMASFFEGQTGWSEATLVAHDPTAAALAGGDRGTPLLCLAESTTWPEIKAYFSTLSVASAVSGAWLTEKVLDNYPHFCLSPSVVRGRHGWPLVTWLKRSEEGRELWGAQRGATGWEEPFRIDTSGDVLEYEVAVDDAGQALVVWSDGSCEGGAVWGRFFL